MVKLATLRADGDKLRIIDPRPGRQIEVFARKDQAAAEARWEQINTEIVEEAIAGGTKAGGVRVTCRNGKMEVYPSNPDLGRFALFAGYRNQFELLRDSMVELDKWYSEHGGGVVETWQQFAAIPVGGALPGGTAKAAPKVKGARAA